MKSIIETLPKRLAVAALILLLGAAPSLADTFEEQLQLRGVKVAYVDDARPLCFPGVNGEPKGLIVDLWKTWSKKTSVPVRFVLAPWKEAMQLVPQGKADILGGLVRDDKREMRFDFSQPLFRIKTVLIVRDEIDYDENSFAEKGVVGVIKGTRAETLNRQLHPKGAMKTYLRPEELLTAFSEGEIDGMVTYLPSFYMYNRELERPVRYKVVSVLDESDICAAVRKGDGQLLKLVDKGFSMISDVEKRVIQNRWFVPDPAHSQSGSVWYWVCGAFLLAAIALLIFRMTRHPKH